MAITRLDNKRLLTSSADEESTPLFSVTKSYAKLNPAAAQLIGVGAGDFIGFGQDENGFLLWKATDSKTGKKLSAELTTASESIYGRLKPGSTYKLELGTSYTEADVTYFPLEEGEETPEETSAASKPLTGEAYDAKYGVQADTAEEDPFL